MTGAGVEGAPTKSKREAEAASGCSKAKAVVAAPSLPPAKNMMWKERVEYILNKKTTPYPRTGEINPDADEYEELQKELAEHRELIRKEYEENGFVYVPDSYEEEIHRCNREAFRASYLKAFGRPPPEDDRGLSVCMS